jgi:DNA-binding NarL/FixJ family response regulator
MVRLFHLEFIKALQSRVRGAWLQRVDQLPPRQRQILLMLLKGQRPKQIAYELNISVATVREHASKIYERFDADDYGSLMSRFIVGPPIQNEARPFGALAERS